MAKICFEGTPGKPGRCVTTGGGYPPYWPQPPHKPNPQGGNVEEPGLYPEIFVDASIVNAIHHATKSVSDKGTRHALQSGIESAVKALQKRGGKEVSSITLED
jgi:hypothetical protein